MEDKAQKVRELHEKEEYWDDEHLGRDHKYNHGWWILPGMIVGLVVWGFILASIKFVLG